MATADSGWQLKHVTDIQSLLLYAKKCRNCPVFGWQSSGCRHNTMILSYIMTIRYIFGFSFRCKHVAHSKDRCPADHWPHFAQSSPRSPAKFFYRRTGTVSSFPNRCAAAIFCYMVLYFISIAAASARVALPFGSRYNFPPLGLPLTTPF